jgi:hypothetical protein
MPSSVIAQRESPTVLQFRFQFHLTFIVSRRPESRPQGGEGVSTALHSRPTTSPAVASGAQRRDSVKLVLCAA